MSSLKIINILYIDDSALPFMNRLDAELGLKIVIEILVKWGLTVHTRQNNNKLKTEEIFFPGYDKMSGLKN